MQKIIVTGASGFIGQYVVNCLLEMGNLVVGISGHKKMPSKKNYISITADIRKQEEVAKIFEQNQSCEGIIHLAADIDMIGSEKTIETNCLGTYYLAKHATQYGMKFFINMSSIPVIGNPVHLPIDEEHPLSPKTLYHITKLTGEQMVEQICSKSMYTLNLRISSPIGRNMSRKNYLSVLLDKCLKGEEIEIYGQGLRVQNYIDVRDIVQAILCGIKAQKSGRYLIAGNQSISNRELAILCKKLTKSGSELIFGRREDPEEGNRWEISNEKARTILNFTPQYDILDSVKWIVDGMKEE